MGFKPSSQLCPLATQYAKPNANKLYHYTIIIWIMKYFWKILLNILPIDNGVALFVFRYLLAKLIQI